ncbi:hypothetical protein [Pseudomonas faucium]|uniref:hypothetical protein n=1 Tax=Pseudomonas faucium TaxID=2740518 RepID=UPI001F372FFD|nr:hypothetical protein [Pseudomonas faucium]
MNKAKRLINASFLTFAFAALANQASAAESSSLETLRMYKNNNGNVCGTYDLPTSGAQYLGDNACKNDEVYRFLISNPSGKYTITFGSDKPKNNRCEAGNWTFTVSAERPLIPVQVDLETLKNTPNNAYIFEGLRMVENNYKKGNVKGKLSCVDARKDN